VGLYNDREKDEVKISDLFDFCTTDRQREYIQAIIDAPSKAQAARNLNISEAPYASHLLYTQPNVFDDLKPDERKLGIEAGFMWRNVAELTVFYVDYGYSSGMQLGLQDCINKRKPYEIRKLFGDE
jgi:hypothetical protein